MILDEYGLNGVTVDESTLSIHFPDMLGGDSDRLLPNGEKDLRIFASLREDGKGGDLGGNYTFVFQGGSVKSLYVMKCSLLKEYIDIERYDTETIDGIQQ
jgi:hypothetical protein